MYCYFADSGPSQLNQGRRELNFFLAFLYHIILLHPPKSPFKGGLSQSPLEGGQRGVSVPANSCRINLNFLLSGNSHIPLNPPSKGDFLQSPPERGLPADHTLFESIFSFSISSSNSLVMPVGYLPEKHASQMGRSLYISLRSSSD